MTCPLDTAQWKLAAFLKWEKRPVVIECPGCGGRGLTGGGFKSIDGAQSCSKCYGRGQIDEWPEAGAEPEIPQELINHMRNAWKAYFNLPEPTEKVTQNGVKL